MAAAAVPLDRWARERARREALLRGAGTVDATGLPAPGAAPSAPLRPSPDAPAIEIDLDRVEDLMGRERPVVDREGPPPSPPGLVEARAAIRAWENGPAPVKGPLPLKPLEAVEERLDALLVARGNTPAQRRVILLALARVLMHQGRNDDARAALKAAETLPTTSVSARLEVARARIALPGYLAHRLLDVPRPAWSGEDPAAALGAALRRRLSEPWRLRRARALRSLLLDDGEHRARLKELRRSRTEPELTPGQRSLLHGLAALREGDKAAAARLLREAARYRETVRTARRLLAIAHADRGEWGPAITAALAALSLDPGDAESIRFVGALVCGERILAAGPHAPVAEVRAWARAVNARIDPKLPQPPLLHLHGTLLLLDAVRGLSQKPPVVDRPLLRRATIDLAAAHVAVKNDAPAALTTAVAHYLGAAHLSSKGARARAREQAWDAFYEVELSERAVADHPAVKALKKRFQTDIPQSGG